MSVAPAHIAFRSTRSAARGAINEKTLEALPMTGCVADVTSHLYMARVSLRCEYRNATANVIKTFGALDLPTRVGGQFASVRVEVGTHFMQAKMVEVPVEPKTTAPQPATTTVTFDVPWVVHGGGSVVVNAVYFIPLRAVGRSGVLLTLPRELIPSTGAAAAAAKADGSYEVGPAATADSWSSMFKITAEARLPSTVLVHGRGTFFAAVDGQAKANLQGAGVTRMGDPRRFELRYENRDVIDQLPKDFEVTATLIPDEDQVALQIVKEDAPFVDDAHRYAAAISVCPKLDPADKRAPNIDLSLLCDCSASMQPHEAYVKEAVRCAIAGAPDSVYVNLMRFGETQEWALPESVQLDEETQATLLSTPLTADMGSTRLYRAVAAAYVKPVVQGHARVFAIISDGSERQFNQKILDLAAANAHSTRVVAITTGDFADQRMFGKLAAVTNGVHRHCDSAADIPRALAEALDSVTVPTMTGTVVEFEYDGDEEKPPLRLTVDHPPMIPAGTRAVLYAFGGEALRACTVRVAGLVGSEFREMKAYTGAPSKADVNSATEGDVHTASLLHVAAAVSRIDELVNMNAKAALSDDERREVTALSTAFSVPSPFAKLQCRSGEQQGPAFDAKCRIVHAPFTEKRAEYDIAPPANPRGPNGVSVDPDSVTTGTSAKENRCPPGASATEYLRTVVDGCVASVVATAQIHDVVLRQQRGGYWRAAGAYPVLDFCGVPFATVANDMPASLIPKPPTPPAPPREPTPEPEPIPEPVEEPPSPKEAPVEEKGVKKGAAKGAKADDKKAKKEEKPDPKKGKGAAKEKPVAAEESAEQPPAEEPAPVEPPKAPTPPPPPPKAPTPPPYDGAFPEDLWTTALVHACLSTNPATANELRLQQTIARAKAFIDKQGPAGVTALEAAKPIAAKAVKAQAN